MPQVCLYHGLGTAADAVTVAGEADTPKGRQTEPNNQNGFRDRNAFLVQAASRLVSFWEVSGTQCLHPARALQNGKPDKIELQRPTQILLI